MPQSRRRFEIDIVQLVDVQVPSGGDVADHGVVLPGVPEPAADLDGVRGLLRQRAAADGLASDGGGVCRAVRGGDEPAGTAAGHVVEAGQLRGDVERLGVDGVHLRHQRDGAGHRSGKGGALQGVEPGRCPGRCRCAASASAKVATWNPADSAARTVARTGFRRAVRRSVPRRARRRGGAGAVEFNGQEAGAPGRRSVGECSLLVLTFVGNLLSGFDGHRQPVFGRRQRAGGEVGVGAGQVHGPVEVQRDGPVRGRAPQR